MKRQIPGNGDTGSKKRRVIQNEYQPVALDDDPNRSPVPVERRPN